MNDKINEQLVLLENELSRLKKVTDYIDDTKQTANSVISELEAVQENYTLYTNKIFLLFESAVDQIRKDTLSQINKGLISFETTGAQIDQTNREKLIETKKLLENYRDIVESTDNLVTTIDAVDFPLRLDRIEQQIIGNFPLIKLQGNEGFQSVKQQISQDSQKTDQQMTLNFQSVNQQINQHSQRVDQQINTIYVKLMDKLKAQEKENILIKNLLIVILGIVVIIGIMILSK